MTLEQLKIKVLTMIEEYNENAELLTDDEDISSKLNHVINQIQNELARFKKIHAYKELSVVEGQEMALTDIDKNIYQLNTVRGVCVDTIADRIIFEEEGTAKVYYFKYPTQINDETDDDFVLELSTDVLEIMPYGIAGDLLKSDVSSNYGAVYSARYKEMIQQLDGRYGMGMVQLDNGSSI